MQTLSYGYKKPESGDKGSTLFTALEDNISRVNSHTHDGVDSPLIPANNIAVSTQTIVAAGWASTAKTGHYRQLVTCVTGFTLDNCNISFRHGTTGEILTPTVEKVNGTQYYVYTTDNTIDFKAVYGL